jgi:hypothetical protein
MNKYDGSHMEEVNKENGNFLSWIQTFSKKIVTVFSVLYVVIIVIMVSMLSFQIQHGMSDGLSTMITEINETFRIVIGGYLIKAGVENGFKITGNFLANINRQKLQLLNVEPEQECDLYDTDDPNSDM